MAVLRTATRTRRNSVATDPNASSTQTSITGTIPLSSLIRAHIPPQLVEEILSQQSTATINEGKIVLSWSDAEKIYDLPLGFYALYLILEEANRIHANTAFNKMESDKPSSSHSDLFKPGFALRAIDPKIAIEAFFETLKQIQSQA